MKPYFIWIIIAAGAFLRLIYAGTELTLVYPDEHFQVLEAANWVVNGFGWLTWEWYKGVRSWFVPSLYMPILFGLKAFGIQGGPTSIYACRVFTALFSCIALWRFWILLRDRGLGQISQFVAVGLMAFSGSMVIWSATTFTETWAACALIIVMPTVVRNLKTDQFKNWVIAGALIGLTFPMRIQLVPWAATLGLIFLTDPRQRKLIFPFVLGFLIPVAFQGMLDWATWSKPFFSAYAYIKVAVLGGVVDMNGVSPWYMYFSIVPKNLGVLFTWTFGFFFIYAMFSRKLRWEKQDLWIIFPAVSVIAAHMLIGHKQARFLMPTYFVFFYLVGIFVQGVLDRWSWLAQGIESLIRGWVVVLACFVFSYFTWSWIYSPSRLYLPELSELGAIVYKDGGFKNSPNSCLLIIDHYWVWSRGEMILGQKVPFRERKTSDVKVADLQECSYTFKSPWSAAKLTPDWKLLGRDRWGNTVYKRGV